MKKTIVIFSLLYSIAAVGQFDTLRPVFGFYDINTFDNGAKLVYEVPLALNPGLYVLELKPLPTEMMPGSIEVLSMEACTVLGLSHHFHHASTIQKENALHGALQELLVYSKEYAQAQGTAEATAEGNDGSESEELQDALLGLLRGVVGQSARSATQVNLEGIVAEASSLTKPCSVVHISLACRKEIADTMYFSYFLPASINTSTQAENAILPHLDNEGLGLEPIADGPYTLHLSPEQLPTQGYSELPGPRGSSVVHGKVVHAQTGEALPFVHVALMGERRNCLGIAHTDQLGRYSFDGVAPGVCNLKLNCSGYRSVKAKGVMVPPNGAASLDFSMQVKDPFAWLAILELVAMLFFVDQGSLQSFLAIKALGEFADLASQPGR